jgi:hypothetical protein
MRLTKDKQAPGATITYGDVFNKILLPPLIRTPNLTSWTNHASDLKVYDSKGDARESRFAWHTPQTCEVACHLREDCLQWEWKPEQCSLGRSVRYGEPAERDEVEGTQFKWTGKEENIVSGWVSWRIAKRATERWADCWDRRKWQGRREFDM